MIMRPLSRALGLAALLLGLLIWTSCSELPMAPPSDWRPNFDLGSGGASGTPIAEVVPTDLGTLLGGSSSVGNDVNDDRWVVGTAASADDFWQRAFLHRPGSSGMEDLLAGDDSEAEAVNNNGQVVGSRGKVAFSWTDVPQPFVDLTVAFNVCSSNCTSAAFGLNDASPAAIVGHVLDRTSFVFRPARWTVTQTVSLTLPDRNDGGTAFDVNNIGLSMGEARFEGLFGPLQAALWATSGLAVKRGPLPGDVTSGATAINENPPPAQIVGWSEDAFGLRRPFIHFGVSDPEPLPLAGYVGGEAQDINDDQVVVGWVINAGGGNRAAIWPSPTADPILLPGPVDNPDGVSEARGINMYCDVVGTITTAEGFSHAALWEVGGCDGAFDTAEPGTEVGPEGGDVPVFDEAGTLLGTLTIPEGALPNSTLIQAELNGDAGCVDVDGAEGPCVQITLPPGTVINGGSAFVVGICLDAPAPGSAVFRTDDDGTVVLRSVPVELACSGGSLGGETGNFSNFQAGPQMFVSKARVKNKRRARKDEIEIDGTFDFAGGEFDPTQDVTITFGECEDPFDCANYELFIAGPDFKRKKGRRKRDFEYRDRHVKVEIRRNGRFEIKVKGIEVGGIDLEFVSFMMQIGEQTQGVGLEFNRRGRCVRANGSPGCGVKDDDEDDDDDDKKKKKRSLDGEERRGA